MALMNPTHSSLVPALFLSVFVANSAVAADAANGERLAERWCSACHVVTSTQREADADAPPHAKMPNMNLTRTEAGDIAAYIARLR